MSWVVFGILFPHNNDDARSKSLQKHSVFEWARIAQTYSHPLRAGGPGIDSRCGQDFPHPSRPSLGPTQPPIQWVPGISPG